MNIVVIRPFKLGDALIIFPLLVRMREKYTNTHITLIADPVVLPLAKAWAIVEEAYPYDKDWEKLFDRINVRKSRLRDLLQRTDLLICWMNDPEDIFKQNLLKAGVKDTIIPPVVPAQNKGLPVASPEDDKLHLVERLAKTLGLTPIKPELIVLPLTGIHHQFRTNSPPIAIHPGGSTEHKCWPAASFAALVDALLQRHIPVLLLGGSADTQLLKTIQDQLKTSLRPGMLTILKNAPLLEVADRLKECGGYVGNDSGITHVAALLRIPTLSLFGPTNIDWWRPLGPTAEVIQGEPLSQLPVEQVLETILRLYKEHQQDQIHT